MQNNGGPAFPRTWSESYGGDVSNCSYDGMSLRDWFAGQIAAGMAAHSGTAGVSYGPHDIAGRAYQVADAMLNAREAPHDRD